MGGRGYETSVEVVSVSWGVIDVEGVGSDDVTWPALCCDCVTCMCVCVNVDDVTVSGQHRALVYLTGSLGDFLPVPDSKDFLAGLTSDPLSWDFLTSRGDDLGLSFLEWVGTVGGALGDGPPRAGGFLA